MMTHQIFPGNGKHTIPNKTQQKQDIGFKTGHSKPRNRTFALQNSIFRDIIITEDSEIMDVTKDPFEEYFRETEPGKKESAYYWQTEIGRAHV